MDEWMGGGQSQNAAIIDEDDHKNSGIESNTLSQESITVGRKSITFFANTCDTCYTQSVKALVS
jgi:hypothetical protein